MRRVGGDRGDQRVQSTNPGVAVTGSLFGVAVDFDDRVVDVDEDWAVDPGDQRGAIGQPGQHRDATASSWRTWPKVNSRRNDPNVDGAYGRSKRVPIAPCRSKAMSSMLSAPATMPATSEVTFAPALAPLSVGTLRCSSANCRQVALLGQRDHRDQAGAGHQIGVVEDRRRDGSNVR